MLNNKKTPRLLRKLFSKEKSTSKVHNDKGRSHRLEESTRHNHQQHNTISGSAHRNQFPVSDLADKCQTLLDSQKNEKCSKEFIENRANSNEPRPLSGLLAAKLSCDEWGIQRRQNVTPTITSLKVVPVPQLPTSPRPRPSNPSHPTNNKTNAQSRVVHVRNGRSQHPSYKPPTLQRSHSMKERREVKEKSKKLRGFTSSLYCIQELPENGAVNTQIS